MIAVSSLFVSIKMVNNIIVMGVSYKKRSKKFGAKVYKILIRDDRWQKYLLTMLGR